MEEPFVDFLSFRGEKRNNEEEAVVDSSGGPSPVAVNNINEEVCSDSDDAFSQGLGIDEDFQNDTTWVEGLNNEKLLHENLENMHVGGGKEVTGASPTLVENLMVQRNG
ncbi:hypothetical protein RIF29_19002 [Crotalaria pallida]|uniref:Uncharacterized protein n=1 Tax=Crotalaria pallida TaxID=3830 RepID=A0AAN9F707_CROPI